MKISVEVKDQALQASLSGYPDRLRQKLMAVMNVLMMDIQAAVKDGKLSGQVLHVRTGTLRRSINRSIAYGESRVTGIVGTNVEYAAIHEFGFHGAVNVREYLRRSRGQMSMARFRTNKLGEKVEVLGSYRKAGGGAGATTVRAHVRNLDLPEKSFLRSTLREFEARIRADIEQAAKESLRG